MSTLTICVSWSTASPSPIGVRLRHPTTARDRSEHRRREGDDVEMAANLVERPARHGKVVDLAEVRCALRAALQRLAQQLGCSGPFEGLASGHDVAVLEHARLMDQEVGHELQPV